jgi:hypothetical protein
VSDAIQDDLAKASTEKKHAKIRKKKIEKAKAIEEVQGGAVEEAKKAETLADYADARDRIKRQQAERKVTTRDVASDSDYTGLKMLLSFFQ